MQLRELERTAESYRSLYQTFLQRFQEATQQQSFPVTEARVISAATIPGGPSPSAQAVHPGPGAPEWASASVARSVHSASSATASSAPATRFATFLVVEFLGSAPLVAESDVPVAKGGDHPRNIRRASAITSYVLDHPLSMFAETLRSTKIAVDLGVKVGGAKVIGMISTLPGEGKSTVAINFAELLAMQGAKTLLIDADLRNPGATRAIGRHAEAGLLEALIDNRPIRDLLLLDPKTKLAFLPAVVTRRVPHSSELLASQAMHAIIESAKDNFDYIILDLPPLAPVVDARAVATRVDSFVYVIEWGKTSRKAVGAALFADQEIVRKCAGVVSEQGRRGEDEALSDLWFERILLFALLLLLPRRLGSVHVACPTRDRAVRRPVRRVPGRLHHGAEGLRALRPVDADGPIPRERNAGDAGVRHQPRRLG